MAKFFPSLSDTLADFVSKQAIFFVGTAAADGRVNVSPKGMDTLKVLNENELIWLNLTGSGNETAAHILEQNRMTIMFCSFGTKPLILRLYGKAQVLHERDTEFSELIDKFGEVAGARQIFKMEIESVQTSCGYAVPFMEFKEERTVLRDWADKKGKDGIKEYWDNKNRESIDGLKTEILP